MVQEVLHNIYRLEIPLPGNPLKAVNSYVIKGVERSLIIDTGLNRKECMDAMVEGLGRLSVAPEGADFFITHLHADHLALVSRLAKETSRVYFNRPDAERHLAGGVWDELLGYARVHGFPEGDLEMAIKAHPGHKYGSRMDLPLTLIKQGDRINAGEYCLECVETPGHTMGHMCLYEPDRKILFSGDHILEDITPNIQSWSDDGHPLRDYLQSLDKVMELEVDLVLPGHRRVFRDCRRRIRELKEHHKERAGEVLAILAGGKKSAFEVASGMSWDIDCGEWNRFPVAQKWFATGEALAHLKYLEEEGLVSREEVNGRVLFAVEDLYGGDVSEA
jgi:glyoxylase-like metal-dependent hydrolase (beta-lactamase superfamily II)